MTIGLAVTKPSQLLQLLIHVSRNLIKRKFKNLTRQVKVSNDGTEEPQLTARILIRRDAAGPDLKRFRQSANLG